MSAALLGAVFLGYAIPFFGFLLSLALLATSLIMRRELWGAALPRGATLAVLGWVGIWLPAVTYLFTGWYWYLADRDLSTAWLLFPIQGPANFIIGTLVPALAVVVVVAVGLKVSTVVRRPWLVVVAAWLVPWAHELAFAMVGGMG